MSKVTAVLKLLYIFSRHYLKMTSQFQEGYIKTGYLTAVSKQYLHIRVTLNTMLWGKPKYTFCFSISFSYLSKYSWEELGAELEISMNLKFPRHASNEFFLSIQSTNSHKFRTEILETMQGNTEKYREHWIKNKWNAPVTFQWKKNKIKSVEVQLY